jgi:hypothetical protein
MQFTRRAHSGRPPRGNDRPQTALASDVKKRILRETNAGQKQMVQVLQSKAGN